MAANPARNRRAVLEIRPFLISLLLCLLIDAAMASYAIYVGKTLTADSSVMIGGSGDEVSSHWLEIVPAQDWPEGATVTVGVTAEAFMPGRLTEIPQARHTFRFLTMNYSDYEGFPPPLTNGGLNEHNVATRDWQIQEATEFAGRLFRRLMYYTCDHPDRFLPEVNEALTAFENQLIAEQDDVARTAQTLFAAGNDPLALDSLTDYSLEAAEDAMDLGHALLDSIGARTELIYGLRAPRDDVVSNLDTRW